MSKRYIVLAAVVLYSFDTIPQSIYPDDDDLPFGNMLTPDYYLSDSSDSFRIQLNKFIHYARLQPFHHPLESPEGEIPPYRTPAYGGFGAGKGPNRDSQHHPALDFYVGNRETSVNLFAAHSGLVHTYRDAPKYRHYLSITNEVRDTKGALLGRMVTIYGHIDLDLDSAANIMLDKKRVKRGDLLSRNLYSGTRGGPHLHFEIRYYRPDDMGDETFYGFGGPQNREILTEPAAGPWSYGYWDPYTGYGFGHPKNHLSLPSD